MGAGSDSGDAGMFGWKEWKMPKLPYHKLETTPSSKTDGSYDELDNSIEAGKLDKFQSPGDAFNPVRYPNMSPYHTMNTMIGSSSFKSIFTDMGGMLMNSSGQECENFELQALECLEYYGAKQGLTACKDWYDDLMECRFKTKQMLRVKHMMDRRQFDCTLEYLQGKRDKIYEDPPKFHGYISPNIDPKAFWKIGTTS
eukprot:TRINITY_DN7461_c0_g1_i1.p1 TRINITY_DN7461_c0_g1~~TRINITY_DN7461_c0_g1_i1.p1  ORF type:complete len:198 (+),score=57.48 TRINITY_DN7461_c0_g1_i1:36-629(+)